MQRMGGATHSPRFKATAKSFCFAHTVWKIYAALHRAMVSCAGFHFSQAAAIHCFERQTLFLEGGGQTAAEATA